MPGAGSTFCCLSHVAAPADPAGSAAAAACTVGSLGKAHYKRASLLLRACQLSSSRVASRPGASTSARQESSRVLSNAFTPEPGSNFCYLAKYENVSDLFNCFCLYLFVSFFGILIVRQNPKHQQILCIPEIRIPNISESFVCQI